ncbi:radical SAM protein [Thermodesulfobacteriota bacterium]
MDKELLQRLIDWSTGTPRPPYKANLEVTRRCNLSCKGCWQPTDTYRFDEEMSLALIERAVNEALGMGVKEWNLIGGEPFCRVDVMQSLIGRIKRGGARGEVTSNGTLLDESLVELLVDSGWDTVRLSLDCPDPSTHDHLRGVKGAFDRTYRTLETFARVKARLNAESPRIEIFMVLTPDNYRDLARMVELAGDVGATKIGVQPLNLFSDFEGNVVEGGRDLKFGWRDARRLRKEIRSAKELADRLLIENTIGDLLERDLVRKTERMDEVILEDVADLEDDFFALPCFEPWYFISIRPNGNVVPCARHMIVDSDKGGSKPFSLYEQSLEAIWVGEGFAKVRRDLMTRNMPKYCQECCVTQVTHSRVLRAGIYRCQGNLDNAVKVYTHGLKSNTGQENLWLGMGSCYQDLGRFVEAARCHRNVVRINPNQPWGWYSLGDCLREGGENEEALACFRKVLTIPSSEQTVYFLAHRMIGEILRKQGDPEAALEHYRLALEQGGDDDFILTEIDKCKEMLGGRG